MSVIREFIAPAVLRRHVDVAGLAGLDYPSTSVGSVGNTTVSYATSLGNAGKILADALLGLVHTANGTMENYFGIAIQPITAIVTPLSPAHHGSGGAYHYGCDFTSGGTLYLDATFALANSADVELTLYIAELSECFMGAQGKGWGCGFSNGEGLSRVCAELATPAGSFPSWGISAPSWVAAGYPDWVTVTEQTDQNYKSTGCAVLYIYWMLSLGFTIQRVVKAGGATLADNYTTLTGKQTAYADFRAAAEAVNINTDNPFPAARPIPLDSAP